VLDKTGWNVTKSARMPDLPQHILDHPISKLGLIGQDPAHRQCVGLESRPAFF